MRLKPLRPHRIRAFGNKLKMHFSQNYNNHGINKAISQGKNAEKFVAKIGVFFLPTAQCTRYTKPDGTRQREIIKNVRARRDAEHLQWRKLIASSWKLVNSVAATYSWAYGSTIISVNCKENWNYLYNENFHLNYRCEFKWNWIFSRRMK